MVRRFIDQDNPVRNFMDAVPSAIFIINETLQILDYNKAASVFIGEDAEMVICRLCGEVMHCFYENQSADACGATEFCDDCVVRNAVIAAYKGEPTVRSMHQFLVMKDDAKRITYIHVSASLNKINNEDLVVLTLEDITELEALRRILPMCSGCNKIRDTKGHWNTVESYFMKYSDVEFTHGICPNCLDRLYPQFSHLKKL
jgi:PAS domain-containing protein